MLADRYLIENTIGEGGMATVYLATHSVLEKQVALKVLHGEYARKPELVERFMQEAKAASRIRHENVIDISDFGMTPEGQVFFAMELLHGHDLHDEIGRARVASQLLPWERSKRIFLQVCAALNAAHALGIIHRDLKPENIYLVEFLGNPDFVKLLDFGIAKQTEVVEGDRKLTRTGMLFGTPEYISPEQARGDPIDPRVDIYAMGCILFQLVTGRVPFEADNFMGVLTKHLTEPPPVIPPEVFDSIGAPRALAGVIDQALAKDREQRFATVDDLARAVREASGDAPVAPRATPASVPAPLTTREINRTRTSWTGIPAIPTAGTTAPAHRSRLPVLLGAILLVGGVAGAAVYMGVGGPSSGSGSGALPGAPVAASPSSGSPGQPTAPAVGSAVAPAATATVEQPAAPPAAPAVTPPAAPAAAPAAAPPAPPVAVEAPLTFPWSQIRLASTPPGADVKDLSSGRVLGRTPLSFKVKPSHTARQFGLHRKGYADAVVELVPDRDKIEYREQLVRGSSGGAPAVHRPPSGHGAAAAAPEPSGLPMLKPESSEPSQPSQAAATPPATAPAATPPATAPAAPPPAAGSAAARPAKPPDEDCDPPCLKGDPSRTGAGGNPP